MQNSSDSEDDPDYIPPADDDPHSSDDEPDAKRARVSSPTEEDQYEDKRKRDAIWAEFQASLTTPQPKTSDSSAPSPMVKIEKRYRFAGEDVVEVTEVPEDSDEARKWPRWQPPPEQSGLSGPSTAVLPKAKAEASQETAASGSAPPTPSASTTSKPPAKRPGPRKPKTTLAPLPGAQKAKKLTTLDKSAMDWRTHVQTEGRSELKDELEANRRGGGYLEKVEFLQRVEERKADALGASTFKRRRG
ncbi:bucentaur or craniofacial development-domain-containing protein [Fomitopsis serialis]|uniref:bucentaur or craniofacial development-domain-containing protein n=1 Tax=Fomitopsis serialis TaxID=139415 RepID=UPI002007C682|nr:bucentaur or craniofacial development-domain-containing protein [Neoantrodia serialis]KAH9926736.1 bucentaur or craniofacial development-domain-containing protein [Neoantrodia serialis]